MENGIILYYLICNITCSCYFCAIPKPLNIPMNVKIQISRTEDEVVSINTYSEGTSSINGMNITQERKLQEKININEQKIVDSRYEEKTIVNKSGHEEEAVEVWEFIQP